MAGIRQRPPASGTRLQLDEGAKAMLERAETAVAEPYVGVRTSDGLISGCFTLFSTDVSTAPITAAATNFLGSLDPARRELASFP